MAGPSDARANAPTPADNFLSNKVFGRLVTLQLPSPPTSSSPPQMLRRRPGRCGELLKKAQARYEAKGFWAKLLTERDAWGYPKDQQVPRLFKQQCQQWPDEIPKWLLDQQRQRLIDFETGKTPLPPKESLRLRYVVSTMENIYQPGPRYEAGLTAQEQAWLNERRLSANNSLSIALLGPLFGAPAEITRALGGSEQQVAAAAQMGAIVFNLTTAHVAIRSSAEPYTAPEVPRGPNDDAQATHVYHAVKTSPNVAPEEYETTAAYGTVVAKPNNSAHQSVPLGAEGTKLPTQGSLSNVEARTWYLDQEAKIPSMLDKSTSLEHQAHQAWELRNYFRTAARVAMTDQDLAQQLMEHRPNSTWEQIVQKYSSTGDDLWEQIIAASQRSNPEVNAALSVTPSEKKQ